MLKQNLRPFSNKQSLIRVGNALLLAISLAVVFALVTLAGGLPLVMGQAARNSTSSSGQPGDTSELKPGEAVERELAGGGTHSYRINLSAGEFLYLIVDQQGIDVVVTLLDPAGTQIFKVDGPNDERGPEPIWHVADAAGAYKVVVEPKDEDAAGAKYQIKIEAQRAATTPDRQRAEAQRTLLQGVQLVEQKTDESWKQATEKFQAALDLWRASGDRPGEADALAYAGRSYTTQSTTGGLAPAGKGDARQALEYYDRALLLVRELRDKRREAYLLHLYGQEFGTSTPEQKLTGLGYYKQSLGLMREIGDRWGEVALLDPIALTYASLTETQKALDTFLELLPLEQSLGDRGSVGITLSYIGALYSWFGDHQKALDYYNQGLALSREVGDREAERFSMRNIGTAYFGLGDYPKALGYFEEINRVSEKNSEDQGLTLGDIGSVHYKLGDYQKALNYYNQALAIWQQLKIIRYQGSTLSNVGSAYRELGDYQKALDSYNQALPLVRFVGDRRSEAAIFINIGRAQLLLGDAQKALVAYQQALQLSQAVGDRSLEAQAFDGAAVSTRRLGNLTEALKLSEEGLKIVESLRAKIATRALRTSYHASLQQYYDAHIHLLMSLHRAHPAQGYDAQALEVSERARSRSLLESLSEAGVDIRQGVDPQLLERERTLQQKLQSQSQAYMQLLSGKPTAEQVAAAKKETDVLMAAYQEVEGQIQLHSPRYAALTQPISLSLKEIQQQLLDPDTLLLEYRLGAEGSFLWAVTKNSLNSFPLPKRTEIETAARRVYDLLTARNQRVKFETTDERKARIARADADFAGAARSLSDMLLAPVAKQLGKNRLLVVSDGALHYIPFAALPAPLPENANQPARQPANQAAVADAPPLIVDHEVVNLPSALSLAIQRRELSGRKPAPKTLAIFADPVFDKDDERVRTNKAANKPAAKTLASNSQNPTRSVSLDVLHSAQDTAPGDAPVNIQRLPYTRREARQITALVPTVSTQGSAGFCRQSRRRHQSRIERIPLRAFCHSWFSQQRASGVIRDRAFAGGCERCGPGRLFALI